MDATTTQPVPALRFNRFLPYWAVLTADFKQTLGSWVYLVWVVLTMGAAACFLLYRYGARDAAGITQHANVLVSDVFRWVIFTSLTLIIVLTSGTICSERGTVADSILSRGISRYQYFLGKWHARLLLVLLTFALMGGLILAGSYFLLHSERMSLTGSLVAMLLLGVMLIAVTTCGVSVSAVSPSPLVSIGIVWLTLYGGGFVLSLLPGRFPSPDRALQFLPNIVSGQYDWQVLQRDMFAGLAASLVAAVVGMVIFSRRDV